MDGELYDEFGNYIGPEIESESDDSSEEEQEQDQVSWEKRRVVSGLGTPEGRRGKRKRVL